MSRTITFPNVERSSWEATKVAISHDTGLSFEGDEGQSKAKGISYSYKYDEAAKTLTVVELSRSFFDPSEDVIEQKIHDSIEAVLKD
jgi:hypothetical protein